MTKYKNNERKLFEYYINKIMEGISVFWELPVKLGFQNQRD